MIEESSAGTNDMTQESSELKCCKRCGAFYTCTHKGECCPECQYFDPEDNLCMAVDRPKKVKKERAAGEEEEADPETFLFEDEEEEELEVVSDESEDEEDLDEEPDEDEFEEDFDEEW